jgi:hypothetical protein
MPGANNPNIHIRRATNQGAQELIYMEKTTGKEWSREEVAQYYREDGGEEDLFERRIKLDEDVEQYQGDDELMDLDIS